MAPQGGVRILNSVLDVMRIVVDATNDDDLFYPTGDVEFAGLVDEAEIARATPVLLAAVDPGFKCFCGRGAIIPISFRHIDARDEDFPDLGGIKGVASFRIDDRDFFTA